MAAYGIDVSHWQGEIDWDKVAASKAFAIIKASEGTGFVDKRFSANRANAKRAGMAVGAYHYFRPGWDTQAQAQHFFDTVGTLIAGDMIPWLDVEDSRKQVNGPTIEPKQVVKEIAETLVALDKLFGVKVGVYTGVWYWNQLPITWKMDRPLWVATWYKDQKPGNPILPNGWSDYAIHQYTSRGKVAGISGDVDLNWIPDSLSGLLVKQKDQEGVDVGAQLEAIRKAVNEIELLLA